MSRSKWQDVLGYDDGRQATTFRYTPFATNASASNLSSLFTSQDDYPSFPRAMSISYHSNPARKDLLISPHIPVPKYGPEDKESEEWLPKVVPIFYISVREDPPPRYRMSKKDGDMRDDEVRTSRPELLLHEGGRASNRVLATAKFHSVTMCTDITLSPGGNTSPSVRGLSRAGSRGHGLVERPMTSPSESGFEKPRLVLGKDDSGRPRMKIVRVCLRGGNGVFRPGRWGFELGRKEWYEWKKDRGNPGTERWCGLDWGGIEGSGMCERLKLVNSRSGDIVAGFVRGNEDEGTLGIFRFYGDELGGEFDVLALISLLSVVERGRRRGSNRLSKAFRND